MKVLYKPYLSSSKLSYSFSKDTVRATIKVYLGDDIENNPMYFNEEDTFDFTQFSDGVAGEILTELGICPIVEAARVNGELHLVLLNFIDEPLPTQNLYPKWIQID